MSENVIIHIKSRIIGDKDEDLIENTCYGTLEKTEKGHVLKYTVLKYYDAKTEITFDAETVYMTESGEISTEMVFRQDATGVFDYNAFYGSFCMTLTTLYIKTQVDEKGASIKLKYLLGRDDGAQDMIDMEIIAEYTDKNGEKNNVPIS